MHKILALALAATSALALTSGAWAESPATGHIHLLLLDAQQQPVVHATVRGACQSDDGSFFGGQKLPAPWSCTSDTQGVCSAELRLLPKPGSDRANACKALAATEITEAGAAADKSSYFTFFADGQAQSYNLLQKGASWKHGDYFFKSLDNQAAFEALVGRNDSNFYKSRIALKDDPAAPALMLDTAAAHAPESREYPNTEFLRVRIDRKTHQPSVQVVVTDTYTDYSMHLLSEARYTGPAGEKNMPLSVDKQGSTCNMRDLFERKCSYQESASFPVDMDAFRQAAAAYQPARRMQWRFQIRAKSGHEQTRTLSHAEFHAVAQALDEVLAGQRN